MGRIQMAQMGEDQPLSSQPLRQLHGFVCGHVLANSIARRGYGIGQHQVSVPHQLQALFRDLHLGVTGNDHHLASIVYPHPHGLNWGVVDIEEGELHSCYLEGLASYDIMAHWGQEVEVIEDVVHSILQSIDVHVALHPMEVSEARIMIIMGMGPDHPVHARYILFQELPSQVWARVHQHPAVLLVRLQQDGKPHPPAAPSPEGIHAGGTLAADLGGANGVACAQEGDLHASMLRL